MPETVRQHDIGEYAVAYDDKLVRCDARQGREGRGRGGVGRLECAMKQDGCTEMVGDRFGLELGRVVAGTGRIRDDEDAGGTKGTQGLRPGDLNRREAIASEIA